MGRTEEFIEWLDEQDYWVKHKKVESNWSDIEFAESAGLTAKEDEEGNLLVPKRDLKRLVKE